MVSLSFHLSIMASLTFSIGIAITSNSLIFAKTPSHRKLKQNYSFQDTYEDPICKNPDVGFDIENGITSACCPPSSNKQVKEFEIVRPQVCRKRVPVHKASSMYTNKFREAIQKMKDLPSNDPRSFKNQAKLHCAYSQMKTSHRPETKLGIHNSWLFFPFHRWYLYFFERILGELIGDPTFGLPYWNWDNEDGMEIPYLFEEGSRKNNPLYDNYRNPNHYQPAIVDLDYFLEERNVSRVEQIQINLSTINKQMIRNASDTKSFFGGHEMVHSTRMGSIEAGCHNAIHLWVGDPRMPSNEDMGSVDSASFDPLFYPHHANIDRMWTLWKDLDVNHHEPTEDQWRNESYVFYDEKGDPVRVYNKDSVNLHDLGYEYEASNTPWMELMLE